MSDPRYAIESALGTEAILCISIESVRGVLDQVQFLLLGRPLDLCYMSAVRHFYCASGVWKIDCTI
jgi:hypothetical protein